MSRQDTQAKPTRRRHAAAFKRELVERSLQPGASVSGIALENGVNAVSGWPVHLEVGWRANDDGVHLTCEVDTYALQGRHAPAPWR